MMARLSDRKTITNEEIEASVEELGRKLEILRVRYEQYFIGVEKVAPSMMRMEVVRMMRDLEQLKIKNTAIKFKLRTVVQKFTSYSTYWNRTLREIEDGTYKRHVDKAKREAERLRKESAQKSTARQNSASATTDNRQSQISSKAVADEADDFLASLGYAPTRERQNAPTNSRNGQDGALESAVNARADLGTSTPQSSLRHRRAPRNGSTAARRVSAARLGAAAHAAQDGDSGDASCRGTAVDDDVQGSLDSPWTARRSKSFANRATFDPVSAARRATSARASAACRATSARASDAADFRSFGRTPTVKTDRPESSPRAIGIFSRQSAEHAPKRQCVNGRLGIFRVWIDFGARARAQIARSRSADYSGRRSCSSPK